MQYQLENAQGDYVITLEQAEGDPAKFWREFNKLINLHGKQKSHHTVD